MTRAYVLFLAVLLILSLLAPLARPAPSGSTDVRSKTVYYISRINPAIVDPEKSDFPRNVSAKVENVNITRSGYLDVAANESDVVFVELWVQADVEVGARAHFQPGVGYYPGVATVHWELVHKAWRVELSYSFAGRNGSLAAERPPGLPDESRSGTETAANYYQPAYTGHDTPDTRQDSDAYTAAQNSTRLYYTLHVHIEKLYALTQLLAATNKTDISATATLTATLTVKVTHNNARTNLWNLKPLLKYSCVRNGGAQGLHAVVLE